MGLRQIRIDRHVEARRSPFDAAQHQVLHCIEADGSARDGVAHRGSDLIGAEYLHQPQNLHELALALLTHPGFHKTPQRGELLRQPPAGQWRSLVKRVDLLLDQGQVMQRIKHEVFPLVGARMTCDHLRAARDHHVMDITAHNYIAVAVGRRHRVVIEAVAHQRQRGDSRGHLLASIVRRRQRHLKGGKITLQPLADRPITAAQTVSHSTAAAFQQIGIQRLEALEHRNWYEEVASRIADQPFDLALVVAFARPAEPVLEKIVRLQFGEHARALPLAITEDAGHRDLGVVIQDRLWNPAEECERPNMAIAEGFRRLCRIADHEAGVRVRQVKSEEVDLALYAPDDADGLTKVGLSMPRRMHQRHEHLLRLLTPAGHIILYNRDATREPILTAEPLKDPLRRMLLLLRSRLVVPKNVVDHWNKWIKLWLRRRLLAHITRRHREPYHLGYRPRAKPKPSSRRPFAQSLDLNRIANPPI